MENLGSKMANCLLLSCPLSTFYAIFTLPSAAKRKRSSGSFLCISNVLYIYFSIKALQMAYNVWFYEKKMGSKMENSSAFVKISTFFHLCHFHSTTRGQRKKVSMIIPMELWYNGHVFINKSIENSWQCLIICKIWGQKWQIGHFSPQHVCPCRAPFSAYP